MNDTGVVIWHEQIIAILSRMTGCDRVAQVQREIQDAARRMWFERRS
ncbi:hypothetical protein OH797_38385 (plasmid) [Streptomyces anulatus]|nr:MULTISPECIES: hypothetical protein [unclassified Streptomyces]